MLAGRGVLSSHHSSPMSPRLSTKIEIRAIATATTQIIKPTRRTDQRWIATGLRGGGELAEPFHQLATITLHPANEAPRAV